MPVTPCFNKVVCGECYDPPISNLSAEREDRDIFLGFSYVVPDDPPIGTWFNAQGCQSMCWGFTQAEADLCAHRQESRCINDKNPPPPGDGGPGGGDGGTPGGGEGDCTGNFCVPGDGVRSLYDSTAQTCVYTCPNGDEFTVTVPAGVAHSTTSQAAADALALSMCVQTAKLTHVCFVDTSLPPGCSDTDYSYTFSVTGGTPPYVWSVAATSLPVGFTFSPTGVLAGNSADTGAFTLDIYVHDSATPPVTVHKTFTLQLAKITTTSPMPQGVLGTPYSQSLAASGAPAGSYWSITAGSLPPNLTLNPLTGLISGSLVTAGTYNFQVALVVP